ncbi:hypothetical protein LUW77_03480 [Streptomyces radiopugnans]|nr:hypothetical protein LUW77_03480 [Streptomyces radiopugnans]
MAESKSSTRQSKSNSTQPTPDDGVAQEMQRIVDEAEEQGFYGVETDPTPNEHYTVAGVTSGKPTPENDPDYEREVRRQLDDAARRG